MLTNTTIPIPNPNVLGRVVDNEAVLVLPDQGKVKVLNEVGAAIWEQIDGQRSIGEIAEKICEMYNIDLPTAGKDTTEFVAELADRQIVTLP